MFTSPIKHKLATLQQNARPLPEERRLQALKQADVAAWRAVIEQQGPHLYRYLAYSVASSKIALTLLRETFVVAAHSIVSLRSTRHFNTWLYWLAQQQLNRFSLQSSSRADAAPPHVSTTSVPRLSDLLAQQPPQVRQGLLLMYREGMSTSVVARMLGRTENATEALLHTGSQAIIAQTRTLFVSATPTSTHDLSRLFQMHLPDLTIPPAAVNNIIAAIQSSDNTPSVVTPAPIDLKSPRHAALMVPLASVIVAVLALVVVSVLWVTRPTAAAPMQATVQSQDGTATVTSADTVRKLGAGDATILAPGDVITTADGAALITYFDGQTAEVQSGSSVTIAVFAEQDAGQQVEIHVLFGRVFSSIQHALGPNDTFRVRTPSSSATVRGTAFLVDVVSKTETRYEVSQGVVHVVLDSQAVDVAAGEQVAAIVGQPMIVEPQAQPTAAPTMTPTLAPTATIAPTAPASPAPSATVPPMPSATAAPAPPQPTANPAPPQLQAYVIQPGDTLTKIAAQFGVSIADLLAANPQITNQNCIKAGQQLIIPMLVRS